MNSLDEQIEAITALLRAKGAVVDIDSEAPDYVKQAFLSLILHCNDCRAQLVRRLPKLDTASDQHN